MIFRFDLDPDESCKNGSELLDRLLKDIVTESWQTFDLKAFIPLLRERIYAKHSFARQFIISWISVLNAVPEINMVVYLPELLDGLFQMLDDSSVEIQTTCETLLAEFLKSIKHDPDAIDITEMSNILIAHAQSTNSLIQYTAINWIEEFVQLSGPKMLSFASGIFTAILPCLAYDGDQRKQIKKCAQAVDEHMLELISKKNEKEKAFEYLDLESVMKVLQQYLVQGPVDTRVAVLRWIHHLFTQAEKEVNLFRILHAREPNSIPFINFQMTTHATSLYPVLFETLSDSSDDVVLQGLTVLAEIVNSTHSKGFHLLFF